MLKSLKTECVCVQICGNKIFVVRAHKTCFVWRSKEEIPTKRTEWRIAVPLHEHGVWQRKWRPGITKWNIRDSHGSSSRPICVFVLDPSGESVNNRKCLAIHQTKEHVEFANRRSLVGGSFNNARTKCNSFIHVLRQKQGIWRTFHSVQSSSLVTRFPSHRRSSDYRPPGFGQSVLDGHPSFLPQALEKKDVRVIFLRDLDMCSIHSYVAPPVAWRFSPFQWHSGNILPILL